LSSPLVGPDVTIATGSEAVREAQVQAGADTPDILTTTPEEVTQQSETTRGADRAGEGFGKG
jgi:hypothetical protein